MLDSVGKKWMEHQARRALKKIHHALRFPLHATSIRRVWVIMPRDLQYIEAAHQFINDLRQKFPFWEVQMFDVDKIPEEKLNWLHIPNSAYIAELKSQQFDMVIDLNRQMDWLVVYLAVMSGAPYRVHLENEDGEFFNIQFKADPKTPFAGLIDAFSHLFVLQ